MKKKLLLISLALMTILMVSCKKEEDSKPATEDEIVGDMLSDEQITVLKDMDMPIYTGDTPPDITGYFHASDFDCIADTTDDYLQNLNYYYSFYDKSGNEIKLDYFNAGMGDVGTGKGAYIFGSGNDFSVYIESEGSNPSYGIDYTHVSIYSGTLTSTGIAGFTQGFILTSKTGDDDDYYLIPVNAARVYAEGDDFADKLTTNPGFSSSIAVSGKVAPSAAVNSAGR